MGPLCLLGTWTSFQGAEVTSSSVEGLIKPLLASLSLLISHWSEEVTQLNPEPTWEGASQRFASQEASSLGPPMPQSLYFLVNYKTGVRITAHLFFLRVLWVSREVIYLKVLSKLSLFYQFFWLQIQTCQFMQKVFIRINYLFKGTKLKS